MSLSSAYLDEIQSNIRARPIPWEGYERAGIIDSNDARLVKSIEQAGNRDKRLSVIDSDPASYVNMVNKMLGNVTRDDVIKYMLSLAGDAARDSSSFRSVFSGQYTHKSDGTSPQPTINALISLLNRPGEQIHLLTARVLYFLVVRTSGETHASVWSSEVRTLSEYIASKLLCTQNPAIQELGAQLLGGLVEIKSYRLIVWDVLTSRSKTSSQVSASVEDVSSDTNTSTSHDATHSQNNGTHHASTDVLATVNSILEASKGQLQLQYYVLLVLWLLSFEVKPARQLIEDYRLVPVLVTVIKMSVKEKIIRVAVAIAVNLVRMAPRVSIPSFLSHGGLGLVKTMCDRKWADDELKADLDFLRDTFQNHFDSMSTFDEYESEIIGKRLRWSPPHKSEVFWKQNIQHFKQDNFKVLKPLANILTASSTDNVSLAVGCNDVGHIVNELPESVSVFQKLGTKMRVMQLMNHADADVRYEALKATQAFMAHSLK